MTVPRQVKGDEVWEWPKRDELGNCTRCHEHPLHCLCGEVVGQVKRWTLEELREESAAYHGKSHTFGQPDCQYCDGARFFLDWLGENQT